MKIINVSTKEKLEELRNLSIFTWEGMNDDPKNLESIEAALRDRGFDKEEMVIYTFKGKLMNESYDLIGDNAYPDDLSFVSVEDYYNPFVKIQLGARWLDDIIHNNLVHKEEYNDLDDEDDYYDEDEEY